MTRTMNRRGLAMLELTLALPLLLLVMALMVNYGTVACWKLRALAVADYAISGVRYPRTVQGELGLPWPGDPHTWYWPKPAQGGNLGTGDWTAPAADLPAVHLPIVRGPTLDLGLGPDRSLQVHSNVLDPSRGFGEGHAELDRWYAMVAKWGRYHLRAHDDMLENLWQYRRTYLGSNVGRRMETLYTLLRAPEQFSTAFTNAVWKILSATWVQDLWPLERDNSRLIEEIAGRLFLCTLDTVVIGNAIDEVCDRLIPAVRDILEQLYQPDQLQTQP